MASIVTPALDLIINGGDKSATGLLSLLGSRVVSAPSSASSRIVLGATQPCRVRYAMPNLSGERAFDDVDLSISEVKIALGKPGSDPYCLATLSTPFPAAAAQITSPQSATADLPATKRITLDPAPYAGTWILTLDDNDPFEIPFDAEAAQVRALAGPNYTVRKRASNAWEISGTEPNQDVTIAVDVSGLIVPVGVSGAIAINTQALADAFTTAGSPKWLRVTREVHIDGVPIFQDDRVEIARAVLDLSSLVPAPIPPSDFATLSAAIAAKQPINSQLSAISSLATTSWGRVLLALADAGALRTYASLQPLSAQLTAVAALAGAAYGRGLLTQSNSAALRGYIESTFANLPDKPTTIEGYGISDYNSLGDARWASLAADALKAPLASPALTGTPTAPTAVNATSSTQLATTAFVANAVASKLAKASNLSDLTDAAAARTNLVLGNVTNTSDPNKPVSTAQAAADTAVANAAAAADAVISAVLATHSARADNPHAVTKTQVGLGSADNTSDAAKPVSTAQQAALDLKAALAGSNAFTGPNSFYALLANSILASVLAAPVAPTATPIGSDEGVTRAYKITALLSDGTETAAGPAGTSSHCDQTLDNTNKVSLSWTAVPGAASYNVYRLANAGLAPTTIGKIANVLIPACVDTGAAGDGSSPPVRNSTGRVVGALWDKGGQFFNVLAYPGIYNDGTDSTAGLQALVDLVVAAVGGTLFFPPGDYRFTGIVVRGDSIRFQGCGFASQIRNTDPSSVTIQLGDNTGSANYAKVRDLCFIPAPSVTRSSGAYEIFSHSASNIELDGLDFYNIWGGIKLGRVDALYGNAKVRNIQATNFHQFLYATRFLDLQCSDFVLGAIQDDAISIILEGGCDCPTCHSIQSTNGGAINVWIRSSDYSVASRFARFTSCNFDHPTSAVRQDNGDFNSFIGCDVHSGIINGGANTEFIGGECYLPSGHGIKIFGGGFVTFNGFKVRGAQGDGIQILNNFTGGCSIIGGKLSECTGNGLFIATGVANVRVSNETLFDSNNVDVTDNSTDPTVILPTKFMMWSGITLQSGWTSFGAPYFSAQYAKDSSGFVHFRGTIGGGTFTYPTIIGSVPSGYRPASNMQFTVGFGSGLGVLQIGANGNISVWTPGPDNAGVSLNGIDYQAA
jgi:hypothetical protein